MDARFWHQLDNGRLQCDLCPRFCQLADGQRGLCFVRERTGDKLTLSTFGRSTGFCVDPIEKKPLSHFLPGSATLSFGTAGCNLACKFCQNWNISKSRRVESLSQEASPEDIAHSAHKLNCQSVSFTYNDPVIFHEYAVETAKACHRLGIRTVAVTAGYICPEPAVEFFAHMDGANIDLKAFSERFYRYLTGGHLQPVLETLAYVAKETPVWLEITTLLIPGENDSEKEIDRLSAWVAEHLGVDVPLHFSAFHPDWKLQDKLRTPLSTLLAARRIAQQNGLRYVYAGNVQHPDSGHTYCHGCGQVVIGRAGWSIASWHLDEAGRCRSCATPCAGLFAGPPGRWGAKRLPVRIGP